MPAAVAPAAATLPTSTPSKVAAAALDKFQIDSPIKMKPLKPVTDAPVKEVQAEEEEEQDFDALRLRFVGDINLPESEEPLLKESKRRFVLFPIQYHEVQLQGQLFVSILSMHVDLADVQEGRGLVLDRGGD